MNTDHIQNLRYKLQKRVRRLNSVDWKLFPYALKQFWGFVDGYGMLVGILDELRASCPEAKAEADLVLDKHEERVMHTERENAALGYFVLDRCAKDEELAANAWRVGYAYGLGDKPNENLDGFRELFLEPLYEYLDEHLDDQRAVLSLLRRYKHKCEWFARDGLYTAFTSDTQRGEKRLAKHLYEFLHDQGLDFHIEPSSISGEADLIAAQKTDDPLIADAKIFDPGRSKGTSYIAKGFAQVYRYTVDFNEPVGYLIVFITSENDLRFTLSENASSTPCLSYNNKTIFLLTIDVFPHEQSASKRGVLKPHEITEADLVKVADAVLATPASDSGNFQ